MNSIIKDVKQKKLSYLSKNALADIVQQINQIELEGVKGLFIEAGCALGGSAIVIAKAKNRARRFNVYDVFGMIPPPTEHDGVAVQNRYRLITEGNAEGLSESHTYYGYEKNLKEKVTKTLAEFEIDLASDNVSLIQGLFEETLIVNEPVAFAHLDGDWYSSTIACLNQIVPNLSVGGVLVIDDYFSWSGCTKAVNETFNIDKKPAKAQNFEMFINNGYRFERTSSNKLIVTKL